MVKQEALKAKGLIEACGYALLCSFALYAQQAHAAENEITAEQVVNEIEKTFGVTPGQRRSHTKGTCAAGEFTGTKEATSYSRSRLFTAKSIPVIARFSLGGGNPNASDASRGVRGMALEFRLPDGSLQHMTMLNTPVFGGSSVKTFLDMIIAIRPDPATGKPAPEKISAFKASHPDSLAQASFLENNNPPASYTNSAYYGVHTFMFIAPTGKSTPVRWRFVPEDGERPLTDKELKSMPNDFLEQALIKRAHASPVRWNMMVTIGETGDPMDDPSLAWPSNRTEFKAGVLTISTAMPQQGATCESVNFDPLVMSNGIEPSDDPILHFRSPAYAYSFARRMSGM